jgi:hypothetical protein
MSDEVPAASALVNLNGILETQVEREILDRHRSPHGLTLVSTFTQEG